MKKIITSLAKTIDKQMARAHLKLFKEKNALLTFLFHSLFRNDKEINPFVVDPQQSTTVNHLRELIEYFLHSGYKFISPDDILRGLNDNERYVLLTFDDGHYNNILSLSLLEEYQIPAVFFVSGNCLKSNKSFWWDVLYRERAKKGIGSSQIWREQLQLLSQTNKKIDSYLLNLFPESAFNTISDIERPFTIEEFKEFAKNEFVHIGNHTLDHAYLTSYGDDEIRTQIFGAQEALKQLIGKAPCIISYPYGNYSDKVVKIAMECGLKIGVTTVHKKNYLPLDSLSCMRLGRFTIWGNEDIALQCEVARSDLKIYNRAISLIKRSC